MSLYIGNNPNTSRATMHLTSSSDNLTTMLSGPNVNTLFHSDFPYMAVQRMFVITRFRLHYTESDSDGSTDAYYRPDYPQELLDLIDQRYLVNIHRAGFRVGGGYFEQHAGSRGSYPVRAKVVLANGTTGPNNQLAASGVYQNFYPAFQVGANNSAFLPTPTGVGNTNIGMGVPNNYGKWSSVDGLNSRYVSLGGFTQLESLWYKEDFVNGGNSSASGNYRARTIDDITTRDGSTTGGVYDQFVNFDPGETPPQFLDHSKRADGGSNNFIAKVYVFNVRYDNNNQLEHIRPTSQQNSIEITRNDLNVGDLSIKNGMILTDQNPELTSITNSSATSDKKTFFSNIINNLTVDQLLQYPFPLTYVSMNSRTDWTIGADGASRALLQTLSPALQLGDPVTLQFSQDQIKFTGARGKILLADKNTNFTPLRLGSELATNVRFAGGNRRFSNLVSGATFRELTQPSTITFLDPDSGWHDKTEVLASVPLPPGSTSANYLTAHLSPITTSGRLQVTHENRYTRLFLNIQPYQGVPLADIHRFERTHPDVTYQVARFGLAVFDDMYLQNRGSPRDGYRMFSTTANRIQSVEVTYSYRVDWGGNNLELIAFYRLAGRNRVDYVDFQDGTHEYFNTIGVNEVLYTLPDVSFDMYVINAG